MVFIIKFSVLEQKSVIDVEPHHDHRTTISKNGIRPGWSCPCRQHSTAIDTIMFPCSDKESPRRLKRPRSADSTLSGLSPSSSLVLVAVVLGALYLGLTVVSFRALSHEVREESSSTTPRAVVTKEAAKVDRRHHKGVDPPRQSAFRDQDNEFQFDRALAEQALQRFGASSIRRLLTAYIEPPLNDTIEGTGSRGDLDKKEDSGVPPQFRIPLPLRTHTPDDLVKFEYPKLQTCRDMPGKFPVDRGIQYNEKGEIVVWNVGDTPTAPDFPVQEAPFCPVELDPFLPWIHDVFPTQDGSRIEFVAQNKRRCRTGKKFTNDVNRLVPQVALMQPVSVQRIDEQQAKSLAPELWLPNNPTGHKSEQPPRYRLAPYEESSPDGMFTRFICRFHGTQFPTVGPPQSVVLAETLSEFPFNYEYVSYRKGRKADDGLLTPKGKDTMLFWTSSIRFHCPVPKTIRNAVATGTTVLSDGTPTLYVDLVPIRTSTRYREVYFTEEQVGPLNETGRDLFDPHLRWGSKNVIPRVEASGRWANIPICLPPSLPSPNGEQSLMPQPVKKKPLTLSACLWASAEFKSRGHAHSSHSDTMTRFIEWLEFHFMVGFDHVFLYDNSGAHTNETSLEEVAKLYPGRITRLEWPAVPCNNNIPAHDSTGERSSQYAAENSCRTRVAPFSEWVASFDTDEYLVPMGNYTNLKDVLRDAYTKGTQVLNFRSSRGKLRPDKCDAAGNGLNKREDATFLEAYNCDSAGSPKPAWAERAKKEIYRSDYVLYHWIHYSSVTTDMLSTRTQAGPKWTRSFQQNHVYHRSTDEFNEAVMVHAKSVMYDQTKRYKEEACHKDYTKKWQGCSVAFPWPNGTEKEGEESYDKDGMLYNCFVNEKVDNYWVPRLQDALRKRKAEWALRKQ